MIIFIIYSIGIIDIIVTFIVILIVIATLQHSHVRYSHRPPTGGSEATTTFTRLECEFESEFKVIS